MKKHRLSGILTASAMMLSMLASVPQEVFAADSEETVFPLSIVGVEVTSENAPDILGNGNAAYDPDTNVLTVQDSLWAEDAPAVQSSIPGLTIRTTRELTFFAEGAPGLVISEDTCLRTSGELVIGSEDKDAVSVNNGAALTVTDSELIASGVNAVIGSGGSEQLIITNSNVEANSDIYAVSGFGGGITYTDTYLTEPEGGIIKDGGVYDADGTTLTDYAKFSVDNYAEYDLTVADVPVTSINASDILGGGEASYDPETNTLTLYKDISALIIGIMNNIDGLTLETACPLTVKAKNVNAITTSRDMTVITNGLLTLKADGGAGVYLSGGNTAFTVKDSMISIMSKWGIIGKSANESLSITDSTVCIEASKYAVSKIGYMISLTGCGLTLPEGAQIIDKETSESSRLTVFESDGETLADYVRIAPSVYDLKVAGTDVTEENCSDILGGGEASYDPETNTLTIKKNIVCNADNSEGAEPCITNRISGLTVKAENEVSLTRENFGAAIYAEKDITVTGKMNITGGAGIVVSNCTLTLKDAELSINGNSGSAIVGGMPGRENSSKLIVDNSRLRACGAEEGAVVGFGQGIELIDCGILTNECVIRDGSFAEMFDDVPVLKVEITTSEIYDLVVGGVRVCEDNASDILGRGEASYDPETNTLTIKKNIVCNADNTEGAEPCITNRIPGLTVKAENEVSLTRENFGAAIYAEKDITVTGKMNITGGAGIVVSDCTFTIKDAELSINGNSGSAIVGGMPGGESTSKLIVDNSRLRANGAEDGAVVGFGQGIELIDSVIRTPEGGTVQDNVIVDAEGEPAKTVWITPAVIRGDVNNDGKVNMRDYATLQKYLLNPKSVTVFDAAADIDGNGKINMRDYAALQKMLLNQA